jgi:hypothetical protein
MYRHNQLARKYRLALRCGLQGAFWAVLAPALIVTDHLAVMSGNTRNFDPILIEPDSFE